MLAREAVPLALGPEAAAGEWQTHLAALRRRLYAPGAASVPVAAEAPADGPTISFRGTADAEILTAVYTDNLADLRAKVDAEGGFHTSTPGVLRRELICGHYSIRPSQSLRFDEQARVNVL